MSWISNKTSFTSGTLVVLFIAAFLYRYASLISGKNVPWYGDYDPGYSDWWIWGARILAFEANPVAVEMRTEGLLYVPLLAIFIKIFGFATAMHYWGYMLAAISAFLPVVAAVTVQRASGGLIGAVLVGILVTVDPVLAQFGLNGWPDSLTIFVAGITLFGFVLVIRLPTFKRLLFLGACLSVLTLSHATWIWAGFGWALVAWLVVALPAIRQYAIQNEASLYRVNGWLMGGLPLAVWVTTMITAGGALTLLGIDSGKGLGAALAGDSLPVMDLAVQFGMNRDAAESSVVNSAQKILIDLPARLPEKTWSFINGQLARSTPFYAWILTSMAFSAVFIAYVNRNPISTRKPLLWGAAIPIALAIVVLQPSTLGSITVLVTVITLISVLVVLPISRILIAAYLPYAGTIIVFSGLSIQQRHSILLVYLLYVLLGVCLGSACIAIFRSHVLTRISASINMRQLTNAIVSVMLSWLLIMGLIGTVSATLQKQQEQNYLRWLGTLMPENALLVTAPNVDPWEVRDLTGRTVIYDVGLRSIVIPVSGDGWFDKIEVMAPSATSPRTLINSIHREGREIWGYFPREDNKDSFSRTSVNSHGHTALVKVLRVAAYPIDESRAAIRIGQVVDDGHV